MRGLIILCIASFAAAAPQGYSYPQDVNQRASLHEQQQQYSAEDGLNTIHFPGEEVRVPFATYGVRHQDKPNEVLVSKKFFIHSAPEEEEDQVQEKVVTLGPNKKNYNVVFIRAPTKSQRPTTVKIIPAVKEDKTIVYVLSKKDEDIDIHAHVEELPTTTTKPEVYFIKYKTPEEANHAQQKIQAEYEHLGGSTQVLNEGVSSVSSVIGSLHEKTAQQEVQFATASPAPVLEKISVEEFGDTPLNKYLPPGYKN